MDGWVPLPLLYTYNKRRTSETRNKYPAILLSIYIYYYIKCVYEPISRKTDDREVNGPCALWYVAVIRAVRGRPPRTCTAISLFRTVSWFYDRTRKSFLLSQPRFLVFTTCVRRSGGGGGLGPRLFRQYVHRICTYARTRDLCGPNNIMPPKPPPP